MHSSACLVTSTPQFEEPAQTAPVLLPSAADPDLRRIVKIDNDNPIQFSAQVLSEDAGERVLVSLLIDYGVLDTDTGRVFKNSEPYNQPIPAGTIEGGPRRVTASLVPSQRLVFGCHTVTMMVTHEFDFLSGCPVSKQDSSQLSWFVFRCQDPSCADADSLLDDCPKADPAVTCPDTVSAGATP